MPVESASSATQPRYSDCNTLEHKEPIVLIAISINQPPFFADFEE